MEADLKKIQVVGLGQACIDYLGVVPAYPQEDGKVEIQDLLIQRGGPASTALVTLSRFGVLTSFLGCISDDPFGRQIEEGLIREGLDISLLKVKPGHISQFSFIAINKNDGKRTVFWNRGTVPRLTPGEVDVSLFSGASIFHTDGLMVEAAVEGAKQARDMGMTVVMDVGTMRKGYRQLASHVDVLIASERLWSPLADPGYSPEEALESLSTWGPKQVIITRGSRGSMGWDGNEVISQEAFPVNAVDTTGAGDVYHGAYIYGLLQNWDMRRCMHFASAVSAIKCQTFGTEKGIPGLEDVQCFLEGLPSKRV
ncbi:carbohydrate kinase family protein [Thermodesulfobacteriota bacterium]